MIFVALLYTQSELKESIQLDDHISIVPLGWCGLREIRKGSQLKGGFRFAYIETEINNSSLQNIGFKNTKIKPFLEFISFITDDGWPIREFEYRQEGTKYCSTQEELSEFLSAHKESRNESNPANIEVDYTITSSFTEIGQVSLPKAWKIFMTKDQDRRDMVSALYANLTGAFSQNYDVFNKDTVKIFMLLAIIEGLLPKRMFCREKLACPECKKSDMQHYSEATHFFWKKELDKKLYFENNEKYVELIYSLYDSMRHAFAHSSKLLPKIYLVEEPDVGGPYTRFMHLDDIIASWEGNDLGRMNAMMLLHEITRLLLLSDFYPDNINKSWPELPLLKMTSL